MLAPRRPFRAQVKVMVTCFGNMQVAYCTAMDFFVHSHQYFFQKPSCSSGTRHFVVVKQCRYGNNNRLVTIPLHHTSISSLVPRPLSTPIARLCILIKSVHRGLGVV